MHCFFANRFGTSGIWLTTVKACSVVSRFSSSTASPSGGAGFLFASEHAASQARHPTQRVVSTSTLGDSSEPSGTAVAARARVAPPAPAPMAATLKIPLRPMFMPSPLRLARGLTAGGDEVEGPENRDSGQRQHEREHHGVAPFGPSWWSSSAADFPARASASLKSGQPPYSPSHVLAVVTRSIGTGFF